jgi:hypothetical protein
MGEKMEQPNRKLGPGWDRKQLSLRLTTERKIELLALCHGLDAEPTPTDAIDRALDIARLAQWTQGGPGISADDALDAVESKMSDMREALERQGYNIEQISKSLQGLHRLMSAIADTPDADGYPAIDTGPKAPTPFRTWLERMLEASGLHVKRAAVVRTTWQQRSSSTPRMATIDLMAELVAIDGELAPKTQAYPEISRIDLIDAAHPICAVELPRPMFIVCQALPSGWVAHMHHANPDGQPGEAIGSHRI